jgi:type IV pilus assembly protein PilE
VYTVDQNNVKSTTSFKGTTVTGKACWLVKGSEC